MDALIYGGPHLASTNLGLTRGTPLVNAQNVLKKDVGYYTTRGIYVFADFVDFAIAFDPVNYWKVFNLLWDDYVPYNVFALLSIWYSHQVNVRWHKVLSAAGFVSIMVRGKGAFCRHYR